MKLWCVFNLLIIKDLFFSVIVIIERERNLLHLPKAVYDIDVNRLLVGRCRCVVERNVSFSSGYRLLGRNTVTITISSFPLPSAGNSISGRS